MDRRDYYGDFGGRYVPDMLLGALEDLERVFYEEKARPQFQKDLDDLQKNYIGRPSPLYFAENLTKACGGAKIYLKLESHNHTGAHKINNVFGQILLAKKMGKKKIIAETGAGQHGLATATACAKFGLECRVFMGAKDYRRQYPNVYSMKLLGADVHSVDVGNKTLKDAVSEALKYWIEHVEDSYYLLGSALGPHPYPAIVRHFQAIIGRETKEQILKQEGRLPNKIVACVGGGSNALGIFNDFLEDKSVELIGVEAGGKGSKLGEHAARFMNKPDIGIAQGYKSYFLQNDEGQIAGTHSISAGLDYAGVSPILADLHQKGRITFLAESDESTLDAFKTLSRLEGIIPALESAHAVASGMKIAKAMRNDEIVVINISGRGDKDIFITAKHIDAENWRNYLKAEVEE